jgi:F0F1-type ATP synthase alpha subunit
LAAHAAGVREIGFLRHRRVELNAMPADVFVQFLARKLIEHRIGKVVQGNAVLENVNTAAAIACGLTSLLSLEPVVETIAIRHH